MASAPGPSALVVAVLCAVGFLGAGPLLSERQVVAVEDSFFARIWHRLWVGLATIGFAAILTCWAWLTGRFHFGGGGATEVRVATAVTVNVPAGVQGDGGDDSAARSQTYIRRRGGGRLE